MADLSLQHVPDPDTEPLVRRLVHRRFLDQHADATAARTAADAMLERMRDHVRLLRVLAGDVEVGHVWSARQGDDLAVLDVVLRDASDAPSARALLESLGRSEQAHRLTVSVSPGDLVTEALVEGGGFDLFATQMLLDLAHDLPAEDVVVLERMDQATYDVWESDEVESYAEERVRSGESPERARQVSEEQHAELLPHGLATEHHHFFVGRVAGEPVGSLWLGTERPLAFVYDLAVAEQHRRKGYGAAIMRAGALWSQQHGAHALGLNVFGHNHGARALYDRLGYHVTEEFLGKVLG